MTRDQLVHLIRAAARIADETEIVVVGSQAVLGGFPNAPAELVESMEADIYPRQHPERSDLIDGAIGELSAFHETFGYYAHGVGPNTAVLPAGWVDRLVPVQAEEAVGLCLEVHDLLLSKYVASRDKDRDFVRTAIRHGLARQEILTSRLGVVPLSDEMRTHIRALIDRDCSESAAKR